jgi:lipoate-protein ligase B
VEQWTTFHGFALNVENDLTPFQGFHPCGFDGAVMTSMTKEAGRRISVADVKAPVTRAFRVVFGATTSTRASPTLPASAPNLEASAVDAR